MEWKGLKTWIGWITSCSLRCGRFPNLSRYYFEAQHSPTTGMYRLDHACGQVGNELNKILGTMNWSSLHLRESSSICSRIMLPLWAALLPVPHQQRRDLPPACNMWLCLPSWRPRFPSSVALRCFLHHQHLWRDKKTCFLCLGMCFFGPLERPQTHTDITEIKDALRNT